MARRCIILLTMAGLLLSGCKASTAERVFLRSTAGHGYAVREAPYNGQYRLYADTEEGRAKPTTQTAMPIRSERLSRGERIGFLRDESGRIVAAVRDERIVVGTQTPQPSDHYVWTMQADAGQTDWNKTGLLVLAVAVGVGIGVGVAVAASAPSSGSFTIVTLAAK